MAADPRIARARALRANATDAQEADGGQHAEHASEDARRTADLEVAGWRLIRFGNNDIFTNIEGVAQAILDEVELARR